MKTIQLHIWSLLIFSVSALYITFPLVLHFSSTATGIGDELVITWIQNWVLHALVTNPLQLFQADIYYPFHNALAYSDIFLPTSILAAIPLWIFKEPIVTFNFTQITSFLFLGFSTYMLSYFLTKDFWGSILAGMLLIFSPVAIDKHIHLQILAIEGIPLALLFFIQFLTTSKTKFLLFSLLFFVLQTYNSFLPGYFILFGYFFLLLFFFLEKKQKLLQLVTKTNILLSLISILVIIPIVLPYFRVSQEFHYTRDIRDAIHFAIQPEDLLYAGGVSRLQPLLMKIPVTQISRYGEIKPGFLGLVLSLLTLGVFVYAWKNRISYTKHWIFYALLSTALAGLVLSFGPALHINRLTIHKPFPIVLPYAVFYYLLPGFQGFRNAARWEMLFLVCIVVCVSMMIPTLLKRYSLLKRTLIYIVLILAVVAEYNFPMHFVAIPQIKNFPQEYQWLRLTQQNTKIIEMPIYNWSMLPYSFGEQVRGYYNTYYFRTTMSGFSGFSPPPWQLLVTNLLADFPQDNSLQKLKSLGITYILVHTNEFDMLKQHNFAVNKKSIANGSTIIHLLQQNKRVQLLHVFGKTYVYKII